MNGNRRASSPGAAGSQLTQEALGKVSQDVLRKIPPQNLEAEQAVLGGVFLNSSVFPQLLDLLDEDDFYSPAHQRIYAAFTELFRKSIPVDLLTVADELHKSGQLDTIGGQPYLAELAGGVISAANAVYHAEIVKEKSIQRRLIRVASDIIGECFEPGTGVTELLDHSQQAIFHISQSRGTQPYRSSAELVTEVFDKLTERANRGELITGVRTFYTKFDEITSGLQPTDLIIIAGRPSMGKTAFALNLAMNAAIHDEVPTAIFSLEMGMDQLMMRMLCIHGLVDLKNVRNGFLGDEDWAKLTDAADALSRAPIFIDDTPAITAMELRSRCRRLKMDKGLGLVVVDYLQLMRASRRTDSREQEISDISRNLKALAKELHVPVIALSQLNRKVEERTNKRPMLSDLRESGAIEQDADVICFIYRDEVYNEDSPKKGVAEIIVGKQRNGPVGAVELAFIGKSTAFRDLSHQPEPSPSEASSF
ncbi:MAG: replicative DNA helicase [Desulfocurvibacter africanus]